MKKFVVVAGSPNTGKTISTNLAIRKLLADGFRVVKTYNGNFWEKEDKQGDPKTSGCVILEKDGKQIAVISYGDIVSDLTYIFKEFSLRDLYAVVCCSHATRGKKVFDYFHSFIGQLNLQDTSVLPIYKNLLCHYPNHKQENEHVANLIIDFLL